MGYGRTSEDWVIEGYMYAYYFASGHAGGGISLFFFFLADNRRERNTRHVGAAVWHAFGQDGSILSAIEMIDERLLRMTICCVVGVVLIGAHPAFTDGSPGTSFLDPRSPIFPGFDLLPAPGS